MRKVTIFAAMCAMLISVGMPTTAQAQNPRQLAAQHTTRGDAARASERYAEAVAEYVLAYSYDPAPERLLNLGRTYEAMGNRQVALQLYRRVAAVSRRGPAADAANGRIIALGGTAASPGVTGGGGSLAVMTIPPGGEIWVDGSKRGTSPMRPLKLSSGQHRLEVRLAGYRTYSKTLNVLPGGKLNEMVTMQIGSGGQMGSGGPAPTPAMTGPMTLTVQNVPAGSQVLLNGRLVNYTGTMATARVMPGRYTLTVKRPGFRDFTQTITVARGQSPVVIVGQMASAGGAVPGTPGPIATPGPTGSLAGTWFGTMLDEPSGFSPIEKYTVTLTGSGTRLSGKLLVGRTLPLRGYRRKQCNNQDNATWETSYQVRFMKTPGGGKLIATDGVQTSCNCESMCRGKSSMEIEVFVAPDMQVMLADNLLFQRRRGSSTPGSGMKRKIDASSLSGTWHVRTGNVDTDTSSEVQLTSRGGNITGQTSVRSTVPLGWRKRDCGGRIEITSTFDFNVSGPVNGDRVDLEFSLSSPPSKDCPCKPHVCEVAARSVSIESQSLKMTADGNHLVGDGLLLTRK